MPAVSWSEVKLHRKCKMAHNYRYHQKLKAIRKKPQLHVGSILHKMLDAYILSKILKNYIGKDPWGVLEEYEKKYQDQFEEEKDEYGDIPEICANIFERYLTYWKTDGLVYLQSEEFVATDLTSNIRMIGYIDKIVKDENGLRYLIDHKFVKNIPSAEDRFSELQLWNYFWCYNRWNPSTPLDGIIWDYARTKLPAIPETLKKGGLSQRKNIDTDAATYLRAIHREGLDPNDYVEMLEHLQGKEDTFFQRVKQPAPSKQLITNIVNDFRSTALMIHHFPTICPREMDPFKCKTCEFRKLCEAEIRGYDADYIRKTEFTKRTEYHEGDYAYQIEESE